MKILIINDLYECGGAEIQARLQKKIFEEYGYEVLLVTLDPSNYIQTSKEYNHISIGKHYNKFQSVYYRFFKDFDIFKQLKDIISGFSPDVIHLHNIYVSSEAVYSAVREFPCVQTVHDYSITCVKSTSIYNDGSLCQGYCFNDCYGKCFKGTLKDRVVFIARYFALKHNNRLKKNCVDLFLSPSNFLKEICLKNGFKTICINNPVEFNCNDNIVFRKFNRNEIKKYLYFGAINKSKGIVQLIRAFNKFAKDKEDIELIIAGSIKNDFAEEFKKLLSNSEKMRYIGKIEHNKIIDFLKDIYVVVIPSLWIENYPGTLLEAVACRCLVLASSRGGMPEMLNYNRDLLFDVLDENDIIRTFDFSYNITYEKYMKIIGSLYEKYFKDDSKILFRSGLISIYNSVVGYKDI